MNPILVKHNGVSSGFIRTPDALSKMVLKLCGGGCTEARTRKAMFSQSQLLEGHRLTFMDRKTGKYELIPCTEGELES